MKKIKCFLSLLIVLALETAVFSAPVNAETTLTTRSDFYFGVNGHNRSMVAYPESALEQQIKLAAELNVKIYRFNYNPTTDAQYAYLDKVVKTADKYGLKLMLVTDDYMLNNTSDEIHDRFYKISKRYDGQIPYIQVYNEVDVYCMNGASVSGNGSVAKHYVASKLSNMAMRFKSAIKGIKDATSNIKTVINFGYWHTYMLEYMRANGVEWDITGLDWYKDMAHGESVTYGYEAILKTIEDKFPQDIMICETNIWPNDSTQLSSYENDTTYLPTCMKYVYNNHPRVKGMIFYELLDEPQFEPVGGYNNEAHFGLVKVDKATNTIGEKKPVYYVIQELLKKDLSAVGDVNADDVVNTADVLIFRQYLALWDVQINKNNADIDKNGAANIKDLLLLRRHLAGQAVGPWA